MELEPTSLLTISIGTLVVVIGVIVTAAVTWTKLRFELQQLSRDLKALRSWHTNEADSIRKDQDKLRSRLHTAANLHQNHEIRLTLLERAQNMPTIPVPVDHTPPPYDVPHRHAAEDSGSR